jgi:hypothetical protein
MNRPEAKRLGVMAAMLAVVATGAAGCGESGGPAPPVSPAASIASPGGERWLAAVEVAPKADDLDTITQRLIEPLGSSLVVSPVDCFEGLPANVDDGYLIGAVGDSSGEVERLVAEAGEQVLFTASVTIVCSD